MTVESAATRHMLDLPSTDPETGQTQTTRQARWYGVGSFDAQQTGFVDPSYEWMVGAKPGLSTTSNQTTTDNEHTNFILYPSLQLLRLGDGKLPLGKATTFKVKVSENDPAQPPVTLDNSYTVNWHAPVELGGYVGLKSLTTSTIGPVSIQTTATTSVKSLTPGNSGTFTQDNVQITVKAGAQQQEFNYNIASQIVGEIPGLGLPFEILLANKSIKMGQVPDPLQEPVTNGDGQWKDAVETQRRINAGLETGTRRINPPAIAEDPNALVDMTNQNNPWRRLVMELYLQTDIQNDAYKLDNYNKNGYSGETEGEVPSVIRHKIYKFREAGDQ